MENISVIHTAKKRRLDSRCWELNDPVGTVATILITIYLSVAVKNVFFSIRTECTPEEGWRIIRPKLCTNKKSKPYKFSSFDIS